MFFSLATIALLYVLHPLACLALEQNALVLVLAVFPGLVRVVLGLVLVLFALFILRVTY